MNHSFPLYYETLGNPLHPCIILIMGMGGQLIQWPASFTQGLVNQGFYVVLFDNRDVGLSRYYDELETPTLENVIFCLQTGKTFSPPYTLAHMASDVIALMDHLNIKKAHIAGISLGGMIAQIVASTYPERVLSLICIASTSSDPALPPAKPEVVAYFLSSQMRTDDIELYVNNKMKLHRIYMNPEHINEEKARLLFRKLYLRAYHPAGFKRHLFAVINAKSRVEQLKTLEVPSLILHGSHDPAFPIEHGKQLKKVIPNAHLEIIQKMGHGLAESLCEKMIAHIVEHVSR